jgi:hypothetical protein
MGDSAGNIKARVPWALDDPWSPATAAKNWGDLDVVNRQYVKWLFENSSGLVFIGPNPPPDPQPGKLWWRNDPDGVLYIYYDDGASEQWVPASPGGQTTPPPPLVLVSPTPPSNPVEGQLWYRTDPAMLCMWFDDGTSSQWIQL